jgi:Rrf2 family transcriptional regulator, iron-sulfur cluster assembly transcription factor
MVLLPRKGLLAIAAVVDVASQTTGRPISGKTLAARQGLPPRHLESLLQSLVRNRLLKGVRGPNGGYELACERNGVTVNDILRAAGIGDEEEEELKSEIVTKVVLPVLSPAEQALGQALNQISLNDIVRYAESMVTEQVGTKAA